MTVLWASTAGEVSCPQHMGAYAKAALEQTPKARKIETPLTVWHKMTAHERRVQRVYFEDDDEVFDWLPACETCNQQYWMKADFPWVR